MTGRKAGFDGAPTRFGNKAARRFENRFPTASGARIGGASLAAAITTPPLLFIQLMKTRIDYEDKNRSAPSSNLVNPAQQVGWILIEAKRPGLPEFVRSIPAAQETYSQCTATKGRQHVPDAVADHDGSFDWRVEPRGRGKKQIRIRFGYLT